MKQIAFLILGAWLYSCTATKITSTTIQDSTELKVKVDTLILVEKDTVQFDSLLSSHLLLEGMIDSLENLPEPESKVIKDERSRALYLAYKQKYNNIVKLRQGANIDKDYAIEDSLIITNKDTTYTQPISFIVSIKGDSIGLKFDPDLKILSSKTTNITEKNRKIGFFAWLGSKYTLYLLSLILLILILLIGKKVIKMYL